MAAQAVVTAAAFLAFSLAIGSAEFGTAQLLAFLVSAAVAVLLAAVCTRAIETSRQTRTAELLAGQAQTNAQMMQAVIKTALDAFIHIDESGIVLEWSFQAEALTGWTQQEARPS
ncbi:PAS domain-containing protein [Bradyrhizobium glycinis]|uniref:PAS domain-containing protein n=1 Tax=Bradyrhizobium glycinis TaxID=2751812 RepID=UPI001FEB0228|nr:PAS domain-containing protein [Bradyrhizobium glycinis]